MRAFRSAYYKAFNKTKDNECSTELAIQFMQLSLVKTDQLNVIANGRYSNLFYDTDLRPQLTADINNQIRKGAPFNWRKPLIAVAIVGGAMVVGFFTGGAASLLLAPIAGSGDVMAVFMVAGAATGAVGGGVIGYKYVQVDSTFAVDPQSINDQN